MEEKQRKKIEGCADKLNACREVLANPVWESTEISVEAMRGLAGILNDVETDLRTLVETDA